MPRLEGVERRPRWVYTQGTDPDPRFSLANERTALAWVRTALGVVASGVALTSAVAVADLPPVLDLAAATFCLVGGLLAVRGAVGWGRVERALRTGRPLPAPRSLAAMAVVVLVLGLVLAGVVGSRAL